MGFTVEPIKAEEDKQETEQDQGKEQESSSDDEEDSDEDIEIVLTNDPRTSAAKEVETVKSKVQHKAGLDIDVVGQMDGTDIYDVDVDGIEDKPWRKPGGMHSVFINSPPFTVVLADITDYFNFGFNELSWKLYSNKQRAVRDSTSSLGNEQMMQQMMMNPMIMQQMMSMSQQFRPPFSQQQFHSPPTQNHLPHKRQRSKIHFYFKVFKCNFYSRRR